MKTWDYFRKNNDFSKNFGAFDAGGRTLIFFESKFEKMSAPKAKALIHNLLSFKVNLNTISRK